MSEQNLVKKTLVIAGIPANKKVVKFKDWKENGLEDKWYETSEKIQELDIQKYGVISGATVEVSFDKDKDMKVVFMKANKSGKTATSEKTEPAKEEPASDGTTVETWTIEAVAKNCEVIKFTEDTQKWRKVSDEVKALLENRVELGIVKGNVATITIANEIVTGIIINSAKEESKEGKAETTYSSIKGSSMDGQSAVKSVAEIIKALVDKNVITSVGDADTALRKLANTAKEIIVS